MLGCWTNEPGPSRAPPLLLALSPSPTPLHPLRSLPLSLLQLPSPLALILRRTQGDTQGGDYDPILQMGKVRPEGWDLLRHPPVPPPPAPVESFPRLTLIMINPVA